MFTYGSLTAKLLYLCIAFIAENAFIYIYMYIYIYTFIVIFYLIIISCMKGVSVRY